MTPVTLTDLQASVVDSSAFHELAQYFTLSHTFLNFLQMMQPTRIISPTHHNYIFYQFDETYNHRITRPLNTNLFIESPDSFKTAFERLLTFLADLNRLQATLVDQNVYQDYLNSNEINKVVYTIQQSIGSIGDSFNNPNQSRKRIGQLFERLIKLIIQAVGLECEPRTISLPIPGHSGYEMPYELDLVFSRSKVIIASETKFIHSSEIVGSVKTTSKDRIDKVFLDKYLLTKLLGRDIPVVAIFLHDVQRALKGNSIFGVASTFKSNHFLGYTVALNKLDGVYYVDPRPEMLINERLREQIHDFQQFLMVDLWKLSSR
ncbi:MAG: hypothetical protein HC875_41460 [Anaerolineales bacterium]|nr:hypothetical protein [Anaerolineales bacterium]